MNSKNQRLSGGCQGSALVVVLWVLGLMGLFVAAFAFDMKIEARITSTARKQLKAEYLALAGIDLARAALLETADPSILNTDSTEYLAKGSDENFRNAVWGLAHGGNANIERKMGEGTVYLSIQPENARVSIHSLIDVNDRPATFAAWEPLFENAGVPRDLWDGLVDCLLDWVDENELTRLNGAESLYYESLTPPYKSKNRPLATVDELIMIKGFNDPIPDDGRTVYEAVARHLSAYSDDQKLNINAISRETLMAALNLDEQIADAVIRARDGADGQPGTDDDKPFKDHNDLITRVPAISQYQSEQLSFTATGRFTIISRGRVGDVDRTIRCVVRFFRNRMFILHWSEGSADWMPEGL